MNSEQTIGFSDSEAVAVEKVNCPSIDARGTFDTESRPKSVFLSFIDQGFAVGGAFLANIVLARTQSKEEYGLFALSYSVFTFLAGLHNSAILEPCTVYGAGRYRDRFVTYARLTWHLNWIVGLVLSSLTLSTCLILHWFAPELLSRALIGLGITVGILLSGTLMRRLFYLQRRPVLAAKASFTYFVVVAFGLWLASKVNLLNSLTVFLLLALGWCVAGLVLWRELPVKKQVQSFLDSEPHYWREHWKYSRWVLATAFVFQLTTQGYYWLVAGFLSVTEVAELRAMHLLVAPMDQVFIALSLLLIPALATQYAAKRMRQFFSLCKRFTAGVIVLTLLFALCVRLLGKITIHIVYGGKFDGLASLLYVLAILPLLLGVGAAVSSALNAAEKPRLVFYAYGISGATTFLVGIPLVMYFGLPGAAYGMLVSGATCTIALSVGFFMTVLRKPPVVSGCHVGQNYA